MSTSTSDPAATTKQPFPDFLALNLPSLITTLLITQRAPPLLKLSFIVLYAAYGLHVICSGRYETGYQFTNLIAGNAVCQNLFVYIALLWCLDGGSGKKHVLDVVRHEEDVEDPAKKGFLGRLYWTTCLLQAPRSVGWSIQVKNVPAPAPVSRSKFLLTSILRFVEYLLIIDAATAWNHRPEFIYGPAHVPVKNLPLPKLCLTVFMSGAMGYAFLNICYVVVGFVFVLTGLSEVKRWPKLFGRWRNSYTLRNFWGKTWHQILRRFIGPINDSIMSSTSIQKGTRLSSNTQLLIGFGLSALSHISGDLMTGANWIKSSGRFFMAQAVAIMVEDWVVDQWCGIKKRSTTDKGKDGGEKRSREPSVFWRVVGYAWVFAWFVYTVPWFLDEQMKARVSEDRIIPSEWSVADWMGGIVGGWRWY